MLVISYKLRQGVRVLGQSVVRWGRVEVVWPGWISITKALQCGWPFDGPAAAIHPPIYIEMQQQEGGGEDCGEMGLCAGVVGMWMKSKGIPKYQRDEVRQSGPCLPIHAAILCFPPSMLWGSILSTKDLSTLFDQYMHFHHSALFCLYNQAGGYKEVVIHPSVHFNSPLLLHLSSMLLFVHCRLLILCVIAFRQMIYLCEIFIKAYLWSLYVLFQVLVPGSL